MHSLRLCLLLALLCSAGLLCRARPPATETVDHSLAAFHVHDDAFKPTPTSPSSDIFQRLHHLVELAHTYGNEQRAGFAAVLEPGVHYITHGAAACYGITEATACLLKEYKTVNERGTLQQQYETLAINNTQVVRLFTQVRARGTQPLRQLDVYFVRLSPVTGRVAVLEHIGPIDDAVDVQALVDRRRATV